MNTYNVKCYPYQVGIFNDNSFIIVCKGDNVWAKRFNKDGIKVGKEMQVTNKSLCPHIITLTNNYKRIVIGWP